jgi:hypothetical protein
LRRSAERSRIVPIRTDAPRENDDVVILGGVGMMRWKGTSDDGPVAGTDVFEYDNDGKIARCTTFFEGG